MSEKAGAPDRSWKLEVLMHWLSSRCEMSGGRAGQCVRIFLEFLVFLALCYK